MKEEKCFCRIDDYPSGIRVIQDDYIEIFKKIFDCFAKYNIPIHVGFVPELMDKKRDSFLLNYKNIIPVQHGLDHCYDLYSKKLIEANDIVNSKTIGVFDDFQGMSEDKIFNSLTKGKNILSEFFNREIDLYIPVCNIANKNTVNCINKIYKGVLGTNQIKGFPYTIENYLFDFYGGLVDIDYTKDYKTFCIHITWEYDAIKRLGFDVWHESFKKFADYYISMYGDKKIEKKSEEYKILFKFPIRQRRIKFFETLDKYYSMLSDNPNYHFLITMDFDDEDMNNDDVKLQLNNYKNLSYSYGESKTKIEAINNNIPTDGYDIIVLISDDMIPQIDGFDKIIRDKMFQHFPNTDGVLWFNDGSINGSKLNTLCILGIKYYKRTYYIYNPEYKSLCCDREFMIVAKRLGKQVYFEDCIIRHEHSAWGYIKSDSLLKKNDADQKHDELIFNKRLRMGFRNTLPEIIFYTSINPNPIHKERQEKAILSWVNLGMQVYSVNYHTEIDTLKKDFPYINFLPTKESSQSIYGKHCIMINTILNIAKDHKSESMCLINSDIEIVPKDDLFNELIDKSRDGLVIVSKHNYDKDYNDAEFEGNGIDVFAFNKQYIDIIPTIHFSLGQPVWDYWFSLEFAKNDIPIFHISKPLAFHKKHKLQWNQNHWEDNLFLIAKLNNYDETNPSKISGIMRCKFMSNIIKIEPTFESTDVCKILDGVSNPIIFELGANKGQDTINLANVSNATVHAFECDKRNDLSRLPNNVKVVYKAISNKDGIEQLWLSNEISGAEWTQSNSIKEPKNHLVKHQDIIFDNKTEVESIKLDTYCIENNISHIDFIWADVQGAEGDMIIGGENILNKTRYLYTEYSDDEMYKGQIGRNKILQLLPNFSVIGYYGNNMLLKNNNFDEKIQSKNKIPKRANFIWGKGTPLSYLRYLTLKTFRDLHPDYEMFLYLSGGSNKKDWKDNLSQEFYSSSKDSIKDYLYHVGALDVKVVEYNEYKELNPAHISDLFRWKVLYEQGGWYFDLDMLFLNSIDDIIKDNYSFIFGCKDIYFVGVLGAKKGLSFFKYVTKRQEDIIKNKNSSNYLMFSTVLFADCMKYDDYKKLDANGSVLCSENEVFYPVHCAHVQTMYDGKVDLTKLKNTIAVHWHGGHNDSQAFNSKFTEEFVKDSKDSISMYLKSLNDGNN